MTRLRIGTWNIRAGMGVDDRLPIDKIGNLHEIARQILAVHLEVVLLQEVDDRVRRSGRVAQAQYLAGELSRLGGVRWYCLFAPAFRRGFGRYGNAILTSYPPKCSYILPLRYPWQLVEPRAFIYALVDLPHGESCGFGCFHLSVPNDRIRLWEIARIKRSLNEVFPRPPLLIGGDLNRGRESYVFDKMQGEVFPMTDLGPLEGLSFGPTGSSYQERIDFLWGSKAVSLDSGIIDAGGSSDHHLVWVECELKPSGWK